MTTYYHVAPAAAVEDILSRGILPLIVTHNNDECAAIDAWLARWAMRMGRDVDEINHLSSLAIYDINRVCVFSDLSVAKSWAEVEDGMVIIQIADPDDDLADELKADFGMADDGEDGALAISGRYGIATDYLSVLS